MRIDKERLELMAEGFFNFINKNIIVISWMINGFIAIFLLLTASINGKGIKRLNLKQLVFLSIMAALVSAIRGAIPIHGAKPTSYIIIVVGFLLGPAAGFYLGVLITIISSLFVGFGAYVPWQMMCWGLMGLTAAYIKNKNRWLTAFFGFAWGFIFGWIMDLWWPLSGFLPLTRDTLIGGFASSFPFDMIHAVTNFILLALMPPQVWERLMNKLETRRNK